MNEQRADSSREAAIRRDKRETDLRRGRRHEGIRKPRDNALRDKPRCTMRDAEARRDQTKVRPAKEPVDTWSQPRVRPVRPDEELGGDDRRHETAEPAVLDLVEERVDCVEHSLRSRPLEPVHERRRVGDEPATLGNGG